MKVIIRNSTQADLDKVFDLHQHCFNKLDQWYKSSIQNYLDDGIIIELSTSLNNQNNEEKTIIGILLQGLITPCNKKIKYDDIIDDSHNDYNEDIFEPINDNGQLFFKNNDQYKEIYGIMMICIDPKFRGKGLAQKLILKHFNNNPNKLLCLNTRRSNINAYRLYKKMGYEHIALIKNKYFLPNEDSVFMIKNIK